MKLRYDLHFAFVPFPLWRYGYDAQQHCGYAKLLGYEIIALTDHNSCLNTPAAVKAGEKLGITVVPGMELCTREEAMWCALFPTVEAALDFGK